MKQIITLLLLTLTLFANIPPQITYDDRHQPLVVEYEDGSVVTYTYDEAGNITRIETPTQTITKTYDALNRLKTVTDDQGTTTYAYDAIGRVTKIAYPSGVSTEYSYDSRNRITKIEHKKSDGTILQSFAYTYDAVGNRVKVVENTGRTVEYTYNEVNQLTKETVTNDPNGNNTTTTYTYDAVGNLVGKTMDGITTEYSYNANDQLIQKGSVAYTYDANGNLLSDGINAYEYDAKNRLIKVTTPTKTIEYSYDADDNRIAKVVNGDTTTYLIDPNTPYAQVITESKENGTEIYYTYGHDLLSDGSHTFLTDALGSTRALVDGAGQLTDSYDYNPYGTLLRHSGSSDNSFLFTGEQYDKETGNYYLRARYYSPELTRFLTRDTYEGTLTDPLSQNRYLYARGNPVIYVDPSGHVTMMGLVGTIRNLGVLAARATISFGRRGYKSFKRRRWTIYKVESKSGFGEFEHTFIWAVNHRKRKGLGFHVQQDMRMVVRFGGRKSFSPGFFGVINQPRVNYYGGRFHRVRKTFITKLAPLAFGVWWFQAAMNVREGAMCNFSYSVEYNSCKHWTDRAINTARLLTLLPF